MDQYVKLPNGKFVSLNEHGYITVNLLMDLSTLMTHDHESLLDLMSVGATGSELLSDISYRVVGHTGNTLTIEVSGCISDMDDAEVINVNEAPLETFTVEVTRVGYGHRTVTVQARSAEMAQQMADEDAGNHLYPEDNAEYLFDVSKQEN